ncbi:O-antigen ligase family protein [Acidobacteriota bacterium]
MRHNNKNITPRLQDRRDDFYKKVIEYGILGLIIFSPLPAASVNAWSILVIELTVLVLMSAYLLMKHKPKINSKISSSMRWIKICFGGFFLFLVVQILPLPVFIVRLISPSSYRFRVMNSLDIADAKLSYLSLVPSETIREGLEILAYVLLGYLIIHTVTSRRRIKRIFFLLVGVGFFEAFYGLFELQRSNPRILFYPKVFNQASVTGTFVNQNHFSGYLEMIIPLALGLIIARIDLFTLAGEILRAKIVRMTEKGMLTNLVLTTFVVVMSLAIVLSRSRSGTFLLVFTFVLFSGITFIYFGKINPQWRKITRFLQVTFILITIICFYVGIQATIDRFALDELLSGGRPHYWGSVMMTINDFPLVGTGLGSFASVYPAYAKTRTYAFLGHAHNDYFEYMSELGIIGILFLLGGIIFIVTKTFRTWYKRRDVEVKGLVLGGLISIFIIGIHSFTDFNLHIPANKLLFTVILTLTYVTANSRHRERENKRKQKND